MASDGILGTESGLILGTESELISGTESGLILGTEIETKMLPRCLPPNFFSEHHSLAGNSKSYSGLSSSQCLPIPPLCSCEEVGMLDEFGLVPGTICTLRIYCDTPYEATCRPGQAEHPDIPGNCWIPFVGACISCGETCLVFSHSVQPSARQFLQEASAAAHAKTHMA